MRGLRVVPRARWGVVVALLAACRSGDLRSDVGEDGPTLADVRTTAGIRGSALSEASGLAQSSRTPSVLWSIDDSGHEPLLHVLDTGGVSRGAIRVTGARNRDWEAVAVGPCATGACVYIGDVGDNGADEASVMIWRVPEPEVGAVATAPAESLTVRWAGGPADVEAMWVGPDTSLWFVTKRPTRRPDSTWRPVRVHVVPAAAWRTAGVVEAAVADSLPIVPRKKRPSLWPTDAALSPPDASGARRVAVRTYADVFVFAADAATGRPGALEARCSLAVLHESQGEGVTWLDAERLLFISEGRAVPLQGGRCVAPPRRP